MKSTLLVIFFLLLSSFTSLYAQKNNSLDSLEVSLENMSWEELDSVGNNLTDNYEFDKAEIYLRKAVQVAEEQNGKDSLYAKSCKSLAILYAYQGMYDRVEPLFLEVKDINEQVFGKNSIDYAKACMNLGILYNNQGFYSKSESFQVEALEIIVKVLGTRNLEYATYCVHLGNLYYNQGLYQKAEPLYISAKETIEKLVGQNNSSYINCCNSLALLYIEQEFYKKAENLYIIVKETQEKLSGKENIEYAIFCNNLALLYTQQTLYKKAEPLYIESKEIKEKILGKDHSSYANSCENLADLYSSIYLYLKAEPLYLEAKNIRERVLGKEHKEYAQSCFSLGEFYYNQDLYKQAKPFFQEAVQNKKDQIKLLFPIFSESEKQEYFTSVKHYFSNSAYFSTKYYNKYYPREREISQDIFNQQLFLKGIIFSSTQKMKDQIVSSGDTVLINQYEEWKSQKENYISLIQTPTSERDSSINMTEIAFQVNELEREISKKSESFAENINQKEYNWLDVKKGLSENEATVEIIRLEKFNI